MFLEFFYILVTTIFRSFGLVSTKTESENVLNNFELKPVPKVGTYLVKKGAYFIFYQIVKCKVTTQESIGCGRFDDKSPFN